MFSVVANTVSLLACILLTLLKKVGKCDIRLIETIKRNESAFAQLVLPKGYHTLIRSLVDKVRG